jgi:tellurite resistance protein TerC
VESSNVIGIATVVIQLIFLEGILSIDNAAVLGAMVSMLPTNQAVPYPAALRFLQRGTNRLLGMQQAAALKVGLLGAYAGRGLMLFLATWVIEKPILRILGAAYLIKLGFGHLSPHDEAPRSETERRQNAAGVAFWMIAGFFRTHRPARPHHRGPAAPVEAGAGPSRSPGDTVVPARIKQER